MQGEDDPAEWWKDFFDESYRALWSPLHSREECVRDASLLQQLLGLAAGDRVLDAPCGYGRIAMPMAELGLRVTGVDFSEDLLSFARSEARRLELEKNARFLRADLRHAELPSGFRAAINLFSSIGYGSEEEDLQILRNIHRALAPGGMLFLETLHRDAVVARQTLGETTGIRGPEGLTLREKSVLDPIAGRMHLRWTWSSPTRAGSKSSDIRVYTATELVSLVKRAGFRSVDCFCGISARPFGTDCLSEDLGLLCSKAA